MTLKDMLVQNIEQLNPKAALIIKNSNYYSVQTVDYAPELLNLGVVLLGYYHDSVKVRKLSRLGDCLSVAHYLFAPEVLKYGRDFTQDSRFQQLSAKTKKHLTDGIQDGTISLKRDLNIDKPIERISKPARFIKQSSIPYVYLYADSRWQLIRHNGRDLAPAVSLRKKLGQLLSKKA